MKKSILLALSVTILTSNIWPSAIPIDPGTGKPYKAAPYKAQPVQTISLPSYLYKDQPSAGPIDTAQGHPSKLSDLAAAAQSDPSYLPNTVNNHKHQIQTTLNNYYNYSEKSSSTYQKLEAWNLFNTLLDVSPKTLRLSDSIEQAKFQRLAIASLFSSTQWANINTSNDIGALPLLLLAISALDSLSKLLTSTSIDKKVIEQIFTRTQTSYNNISLLSHLKIVITEEMSLSPFKLDLKQALYKFLRSYHDRFGDQTFTDFKYLSKWVKHESDKNDPQSLTDDIKHLFDGMENWIQSSRKNLNL